VPVDLKSKDSITKAFDTTIKTFGRVDVVVNNAGYGLIGEFESVPVAAGRELFEINYWAPIQIMIEAVRIFREVNPLSGPIGGVIAQVSSAGGYITAPGGVYYHSSKWALEASAETLVKELDSEWHIRAVIFEPGSVKTKWSNANMVNVGQHPAYMREESKLLGTDLIRNMAKWEAKLGADATNVANLMVKVVRDEEGKWGGRNLLRLPVGADSWTMIKSDVEEVRGNLEKWKKESESTSPGDVKETLMALGLIQE
jgi:short-subunit dehydrogenase